MEFEWKQLSDNGKGSLQKWTLIHKETGRPVLVIGLSRNAETYDNWKIRKKIKRTYEWYHTKVWFNKLKV